MPDLIIALQEEIGNPDLFTGRRAELASLLLWAKRSKQQYSKSRAILSRRKKGKTALVQRFFNILYSQHDPQVVPFFYRVSEQRYHLNDFAEAFYRAFMTQYLSFYSRDSRLVNNVLPLASLKTHASQDAEALQDIEHMEEILASNPNLAWDHAQRAPHRLAAIKDIRIIQIIDEFQFMNRFIYSGPGSGEQENICHSYMGAAESKVAPMIVTGSYIGWLDAILTHMTSRFDKEHLHGLTDEEALETVYNYATHMEVPIREATAPYIARSGFNDPFYISQIIRTKQPGRDLTTEQGVRASLQFETTADQGYIANVWLEYIVAAFSRVNEVNAKKIVLYLAKYGDQERSRKQIREDLHLELPDNELELRLHKLRMADLIAPGSSFFHYKGLGDPIFEVVFRKVYGPEIEALEPSAITDDFEKFLTRIKRQTSWMKGLRGEYKVRYHLYVAGATGVPIGDVIYNPSAGITLEPYASTKKERLSGGIESSREVDVYARSEREDGTDLVVEVKNWEKPIGHQEIEAFLKLKAIVEKTVTRKTGYLFYSENGFTSEQKTMLEAAGVMYSDGKKLTSYEAGQDASKA